MPGSAVAFSKIEGANSSPHPACTLLPHRLIPTTLQQLLGACSSPRQINQRQLYYSWQPRHRYIGTAPPYCYRLLLHRNPLTPNPNTTCPVAAMQAPPINHCNHITATHHAAPSVPRRLPGQTPYPIHPPPAPAFLACSDYLPSDTRYLCHC